MVSRRDKPKHKSSSKYNNPSKLSNASNICNCRSMRGHTEDGCYKSEQVPCSLCKKEGHLLQSCKKEATESKAASSAFSLKSANDFSEATDHDLVKESGSTEIVIVQKSSFRNLKELNRVVENPVGGNTKFLRKGEVKVLAKDNQGEALLLVLENELFVPGYWTKLVSVSSIVDNGHNMFIRKKKFIFV